MTELYVTVTCVTCEKAISCEPEGEIMHLWWAAVARHSINAHGGAPVPISISGSVL